MLLLTQKAYAPKAAAPSATGAALQIDRELSHPDEAVRKQAAATWWRC